jgi:beta-galactosidase
VITAAVVDEAGRVVPDADQLLRFAVSGSAAIIGVGNGNPTSLEPDRADQRRAFNGLCAAILQAGEVEGPINVVATAAGLRAGQLTIDLHAAALRPRA